MTRWMHQKRSGLPELNLKSRRSSLSPTAMDRTPARSPRSHRAENQKHQRSDASLFHVSPNVNRGGEHIKGTAGLPAVFFLRRLPPTLSGKPLVTGLTLEI